MTEHDAMLVDSPSTPRLPEASPEQFRLVQLQTYDWGTLAGRQTIPIPEEGFLVVGPSGSGKSTLLDAHAALLTPPKWLGFNVAAREADKSRDRNAMSYVRGAWAQQTSEEGTTAIQYLRAGSTWSAIAETYRNGEGKVVVLAAVLWVKGKGTATTELKKRYLVLEREFDINELQFFPKADFDVKRLRVDLRDAAVFEDFSGYQERFRRLMEIDNELALRLLHKTQSAKNLGELNVFLRDFMLDEPETFVVAQRLVSEFGELRDAHQAVVQARKQIETLIPARDDHAALQAVKNEASVLAEVKAGMDIYRTQRRKDLLEQAISELYVKKEGVEQERQRLDGIVGQHQERLNDLRARRIGEGGGIVERLEGEIRQAESTRDTCLGKREQALSACRTLGLTLPDNPHGFAALAEGCRVSMERDADDRDDREAKRDALKAQEQAHIETFKGLRTEIEAMERHRTNIPAQAQAIRARLCEAEGIDSAKLPYAGELMEVRDDCLEWQPALERLLHNPALTLLVEERYYASVSRYVNENNIGGRLVYLRMLPQPDIVKPLHPKSSLHKLKFAPGAHGDWLRKDLAARFDYLCTDTLDEFRSATRAVTQSGQIKHSTTRHEKDDSYPVHDRTRWVMGFDNAEKLALYQRRAHEVVDQLQDLKRQLEHLREQGETAQRKFQANVILANLRWAEVDAASALDRVRELQAQLAREKSQRPDLAELDRQIGEQDKVLAKAQKDLNDKAAELRLHELNRQKLVESLQGLPDHLLEVALTPTQAQGLDARFAALGPLTLDNLESFARQVSGFINGDERAQNTRTIKLETAIEGRFAEFCRLWPAESDGLDPKMASADDFLAKLGRLESDGLPKHEKKFFELLRDQSDQNLAMLSTYLDQERRAILDRLEDVNASLAAAEFNPGTHLVIEPEERHVEEVRQFKLSLRGALDRSFDTDPAVMEQRFASLAEIVRRLGSVDTVDRNWQHLVLDVRQHVEFVAREFDSAGLEKDVYRSGAGKSGGQRQKLAATCLAAALRYQLGGEDRSLPTFTTVVLDEAFDKADAEFTATAMNIFKTFGFQMVVATPLKSVMTLEPFIGGACFVNIRERKFSSVLLIEYDQEQQRLRLPGLVTTHVEEALAS